MPVQGPCPGKTTLAMQAVVFLKPPAVMAIMTVVPWDTNVSSSTISIAVPFDVRIRSNIDDPPLQGASLAVSGPSGVSCDTPSSFWILTPGREGCGGLGLGLELWVEEDQHTANTH